MRIIIEVEGQPSGPPEVVLRSSSESPRSNVSSLTSPGAGGGIDAGPAPSADGVQSQSQITTPLVPGPLQLTGRASAGPAPSTDAGA
jgi:hypothetical protein